MYENNGRYRCVMAVIDGFATNRDVILPWYSKKLQFKKYRNITAIIFKITAAVLKITIDILKIGYYFKNNDCYFKNILIFFLKCGKKIYATTNREPWQLQTTMQYLLCNKFFLSLINDNHNCCFHSYSGVPGSRPNGTLEGNNPTAPFGASAGHQQPPRIQGTWTSSKRALGGGAGGYIGNLALWKNRGEIKCSFCFLTKMSLAN